ncbi:MAG: iron-sulfur cluster assembly protein [Patescibacteria group bacterium]
MTNQIQNPNVKKDRVIEMIETILDPEVGLDIHTMGLIYDIKIKSEKEIYILMTFTSPLCPVGEYLKQEVTDNMRELGFSAVEVEVTFEPPWQPPPALREALGI